MGSNSVTLTGDWDRLKSVLDSVAGGSGGGRGGRGAIARASNGSLGRCLKKIEARVLYHLDHQDLEWQSLSEQYAKQKEKKGISPDILRASNTMARNITTVQEDDFSGMVGVSRGVKNGDGNDVTDIALIHEQPDDDGTKIPARKLWKPTFEELKDEIAMELIGTVIKVFKS